MDPKLRTVEDGGQGGGRGVDGGRGRPHQLFLFAEEKDKFVYCQHFICGLLALDDHFNKIYFHTLAHRANNH